MTDKQKQDLKKAFKTFLKALIPPVVALVSSVLTTLLSSGDVASATLVGTTIGTGASILARL